MAKARSNSEDLNWREFAALSEQEREGITRRVLELKLTKLDPDVCREVGILLTVMSRILYANRCEQRGKRIHDEFFGMSQHNRLTVAIKAPVDAATLEPYQGRPLPDLARYSPRRRGVAPAVEIGQMPPERDVRALDPDEEDASDSALLSHGDLIDGRGDDESEDDSRLQRRHTPHNEPDNLHAFPRRHRADFATPPRGGRPAPRPRPRNNREGLVPEENTVDIGHPDFIWALRAMEDSLARGGSGKVEVSWVGGEIIAVNAELVPAADD